MRIELRGVKKRFGRVEVLKGIDLAVAEGQRVALIGPNGSGKSTFLRALLGLVACDGEVRLGDRSVWEDRIEVARRLAYVPQAPPQLSAPVGEVVRTVCATRGLPSSEVASVARRLDLDLAAIGDRPFRALSGGMKQKVLIAVAFAARPTLLVMDEPTASLDASARERFFELFAELPQGVTTLLCSHRLEELRHLSDHVVALEDGLVVFDGPAAEYLKPQVGRVVALSEGRPVRREEAGHV